MIRSLLELTRPLNCTIAAVGVAVGALLAGGDVAAASLLQAMAAAAAIGAAGNIFNDIFDLEIDRLNRPDRPLPNGRISIPVAGASGLLLGGVGLVMAARVSLLHLLVASAILLAILIYDRWLKRVAVAGNLVVSLAAAAALPFGGFLGAAWSATWVPALFAFLLHLAREVVKDVEDMDGDRLAGARTLPVRVGRHRALSVAIYVLFTLIALTPVPHLLGWYGIGYMRVVVFLNAACVALIVSLHRNPLRTNLARVSGNLKMLMILGIVAVMLG
jgi:geranylgeranylglycerol-phosphate geranylgeranyltransferase